MKKKILLSILIVATISGITYAVTQAFFTDRETSTGSTFTVGTLDLSVGGANGTNVEAFVIEGIGASGDISGGKTWTVTNEGTLPGRLFFRLANLVNYDNGCNEPEALLDTTCDDTTLNEGELGDVIVAHVLVDDQDVFSTLAKDDEDTLGVAWRDGTVTPIIIAGGASKTVTIEWETGQDGYDNRIQSDSLGFDVVFDLEQINTSPTGQVNQTE